MSFWFVVLEEAMALMSGSELIEASRDRIIVASCATDFSAYRRVLAAAQSGPQLAAVESNIHLPSQSEASRMQRVWWHWWRNSEKPESLPLVTAFQNTSSNIVEKAIRCVVGKHGALLSRFVETDNELSAHINDAEKFEIENLLEFHSAEEAGRCYEKRRATPIRHEGEWLIRAAIARVQNNIIVALEMSHLICDGYSLNVLEKDLRQTVAQLEADRVDEPKRDFSFFAYAAAECNLGCGELLRQTHYHLKLIN
jgi:hypothetical protein